MDLRKLENENTKNVRLIKISDNHWYDPHFFIRKYKGSSTLHMHEYIQINYILEGKGTHNINNNSFDITKGDIFVIPPFVPHYITFKPGESFLVMEFEFETGFINEAFQSMDNIDSLFDFAYIEPFLVSESQVKPRLNLVGMEQLEIEEILNEVFTEYTEKKPGYALIAKSLLLKLLVIVGRQFTAELRDSKDQHLYTNFKDGMFQAIDYIHNNYLSELKLESIAKKYFFSPSYFSYLFKTITGKTYIEYINDLRISSAMELLKSTNKRILDIGMETGFNYITHFNRLFKRKTGMSPNEYRKLMKESKSDTEADIKEPAIYEINN